jgi:hypothetical protein
MLRKFAIQAVLFFIPVIIGCIALEMITRSLSMRYAFVSEYLEKESAQLEVMVLGSSQMKDAVNPQWLSKPSINLASTSQHHNTDFKLYEGLKDQMPLLNTVVVELSYAHLELPHNDGEFWKNNVYLEYYGVNCFDREAWFKDRFIYISNPPFYSDAIYKEYISKEDRDVFNEFGFNINCFEGAFSRNNFNEDKIAQLDFVIQTSENIELFEHNSDYFLNMIRELETMGMEVVVTTTPLYNSYKEKRNPNILKRRDSILEVVQRRYPRVRIFNCEADCTEFTIKDFLNHNHLNRDGARKFAEKLDQFLQNKP